MLSLSPKRPKQSLNKAYLKNAQVVRDSFDNFKTRLRALLTAIDETESEENVKNHLAEFLKKTFYENKNEINTKGRTDLVIHAENKAKSPVNVLLEVKKPSNTAEMISREKLNTKAMQELVLYYLREREEENNTDIKYLIISNIYEFFIFDAADFEKLFYENKRFLKEFKDWQSGKKSSSKTAFFYQDIVSPFLEKMEAEISATYFNLQDYQKAGQEEEEKLIALYLIFSPEHLLKTYSYDSNQLNQGFYEELLHILGLEEVKSKGKKLIQRKKEKKRDFGSFIENTMRILKSSGKLAIVPNREKYGETEEEQRFAIALELVIGWINRILFLKLLEGQLVNFHQGDPRFTFLNAENLHDFDDLYELFFEVLAVLPKERRPDLQAQYAHVPYLNSSLFAISELELYTHSINALSDRVRMPFFSKTVLVDGQNKPESGQTSAFSYLLRFLDAYDFAAEGKEKIQEQRKDLINASVLGLIFEKLNGYQDGSFYTPGFITMYMARESLRKTVLDKFNAKYGWNCPDFDNLVNYMQPGNLKEYNEVVNSIKVCDPAVGSGHFLVSILNEFLAIKSELGIFHDSEERARYTRDYEIVVENDELVLLDEFESPFEYTVSYENGKRKTGRRKTAIQQAIFQEKKHLIENCLYGVDINPNSVKICRLRLWIELLKHTYYKPESDYKELEVLPNLDMKILEGNSLIPTVNHEPFEIDWEKGKLQTTKSTEEAIGKINAGVEVIRKNTQALFALHDREAKRERMHEMHLAKVEIALAFYNIEIFKTKNALSVLDPKGRIDGTLSKKEEAQRVALQDKLEALEAKHFRMFLNRYVTYQIPMFDWKIMFSEILGTFKNGDDADYGFDLVIGNPPYIRQEEIKPFKPYLENRFETFAGTADLFVYFIELGMQMLCEGGSFTYIVPNKWMRAGYGKALRQFVKSFEIREIVDFGDLPVFTEATTYPCILSLKKAPQQPSFLATNVDTLDFPENMAAYIAPQKMEVLTAELPESGWTLTSAAEQQLLAKLRQKGKPLGEYVDGKIFYGIKTGYNEAFVIDEETKNRLIAEDAKSAEVIKPFLAGRDIKRYQQPKATRYLIFTRRGIEIEKYPAILNYLEGFKEQLMPRPANFTGNSKDWPGRKSGSYKWYEIQDAVDYYDEFEKSKVMLPDISIRCEALLDKANNFYCVNTAYIIPGLDENDLGLLNSKLILFFYENLTQTIRGGYFRFIRQYLEQIPIIKTDNLKPLVTQILAAKKADPSADTRALEAEIDQLVYALYGLTAEEIALVES